MKKALKLIILCATIMAWPFSAWADFSGTYAPANWTTTLQGNPPAGGGTVDTSNAPASITLNGGDDDCSEAPCYLDYTIEAPATGSVSFHWEYETQDGDGASYDLFLLLHDGTEIQLSDDAGADIQSGDHTFEVTAGQTFGFRLDCTDCAVGPASATISNFIAPLAQAPVATVQPVPTLQEWALIAMAGLMGLFAFAAFRRQG